ncbi:MAG: hypothetical protein IKU90_07145 [Clostridia bacterium]|nr:hypothetical protein [Clostridia bacterium]
MAENPEAFGLVPDACPAVTSELLIAANGHSAAGGVAAPTFPVEEGGAEGIYETLFDGLLPHGDDDVRLLRDTFGESEGMQDHLVSRYCAALVEGVAFRLLTGAAKDASPEQACALLGNEIHYKLRLLRDKICDDGLTVRDGVFYTVSLGICRIVPRGEGNYTLDIFAAGDFRVYLLDGQGMHPLWLTDTPVLSPDSPTEPRAISMELHHPEPFGILLLSDSVCAVNAAEHRALKETPGLIWRYRMRLEDYFLRIVTSCVREQEFGERATRFFTGRPRGRESASGAMMILKGDASYEVFQAACQARLACLEDMISLLPDGYDPDTVKEQPPLEEIEKGRLRRLLDGETALSDRTAEALRICALEKLEKGNSAAEIPVPEGVPAYSRLTYDEVRNAYRRYDEANDADRARVAQNRRIMRDNLADHWVALRPHFLRLLSHSLPSGGDACERSYAACADMNSRLGRMLAARKETLARLDGLLSDSLTVLRTDGKDWLSGRAGDGSAAAWSLSLQEALPDALAPLLTTWQEETGRYRSLMSAYTYEREQLFRMDAESADGFFASDWQGITDGSLPDERWEALADCLMGDQYASYRELWESLRRVSEGTGVLLSRIRSRGAERRMARELANRVDLRVCALRASAYEDADWGEAVVALMDPTMRREHHAAVRRWQETCELNARRATAFEEYRAAYGLYPAGRL